jgi:putative hydrolase of HD superfamily
MPCGHNRDRNEADARSVSRGDEGSAGLLALARRVATLKSAPRTGWLDRDVDPARVESVADHSFAVALLAWVLATERRAQGAALDPERVLTLALLHDLAEAETGDLTPYDPAQIPEPDDAGARRAFLDRRHVRDAARSAAKRDAEAAAMEELLLELPPTAKALLAPLWDELRRGESAESRFVKQVDRLETFLQSRRYLTTDPDLPMGSFRQEVMETIDDPLLVAVRDAALSDEEDVMSM